MGLPRIIGLSGKIGTGKTTLTNLLLKSFPEYERVAFGDILKREASEMHNFPLEWAYSEEGKSRIVNPGVEERKSLFEVMGEMLLPPEPVYNALPRMNMTVREVLQWHGTEYRRNQDPDYWINRMRDHVKENPWVVIDDVRFVNEANLVFELGGLLVRVDPHNEWKPGKFADHASEVDLDDYTKFDFRAKQVWNNPQVATDAIINYINNLS